MLSESQLNEIAVNNSFHAQSAAWLYENATTYFHNHPNINYVAITECPPKSIHLFKHERTLKKFAFATPQAEYKVRGFDQEIFML
ncbi:MAG: hypothetical protein KAR47_21410 [Planctomycetes bacterium]|nr:hypothetical protein [Planctomycetota bacterium]